MHRIKNWFRISMKQAKLTDLSVINIERDLSTKIDKDKTINYFAISQRRISLIKYLN